ncbi:MAG: Ig-like domain-containing protein [Saprospiraceae bacterium]
MSSNPAIATVTSGGIVTGIGAGTATITYTDVNGCETTATVTVIPLPTMSGGTVCVGSTITLLGSGIPANSNIYVSSNPAVATVTNGGIVTGVSAGTANITYTNNNGCQVTATVTVSEISAVSFTNQSACDDNATPSDGSDDWFYRRYNSDLANPPAGGTLDLTGDVLVGGGVTSVLVATAGTYQCTLLQV